jgi:hypothetical protein
MRRIIYILIFLLVPLFSLANTFVPIGHGSYQRRIDLEKGSINSTCDRLGYKKSMFYTYDAIMDGKSDIICVCYKIFTQDIICIITDDNVTELTNQDVDRFSKRFDFNHVFGPWEREYHLTEGINDKELSYSFMSNVLDLKQGESSGCFIAESFGYRLFFKNNLLCKWESSDGLNKNAKEWKEINPDYYEICYDKALYYWKNDSIKAIQDVNMQAEAFSHLPVDLIKYKDFYKDEDGFINYKMLIVTFHLCSITLRDFKDNTYGDYYFFGKKMIRNHELYKYRYKMCDFYFSKSGTLFNMSASDHHKKVR